MRNCILFLISNLPYKIQVLFYIHHKNIHECGEGRSFEWYFGLILSAFLSKFIIFCNSYPIIWNIFYIYNYFFVYFTKTSSNIGGFDRNFRIYIFLYIWEKIVKCALKISNCVALVMFFLEKIRLRSSLDRTPLRSMPIFRV